MSDSNAYRYVGMVYIPQRTFMGEQLQKTLVDLRDKLSRDFPMSGFRVGMDRTALWINVEITGKVEDDAVRMKLWEFGQAWSGAD
ncbi:hypothetical protein BH10PSE17_BH10PSE17_00340 [soil metagenome]